MTNINGHDHTKSASPISKNVASQEAGPLFETVEVKLETFVGDTTMSLAQVNALKEGSIVPLDATLNEAVEIRVNGLTIAHGELVSVGDRFGVRIIKVSR